MGDKKIVIFYVLGIGKGWIIVVGFNVLCSLVFFFWFDVCSGL